MSNEIFHKHYDEDILNTISNKDLMYLYSFFNTNRWIEYREWKKIEREILRRIS